MILIAPTLHTTRSPDVGRVSPDRLATETRFRSVSHGVFLLAAADEQSAIMPGGL